MTLPERPAVRADMHIPSTGASTANVQNEWRETRKLARATTRQRIE